METGIVVRTRLTIEKKYLGKGISIKFPVAGEWCVVPHDELVRIVGEVTPALKNRSWNEDGRCHWPDPATSRLRSAIQGYRVDSN